MRDLIITRSFANSKQTLGQAHVIECERSIFSCDTLELPDLNNQVRISRIPEGVYCVKKRTSNKFGLHFHITGVKGRTYILIHKGNYHSQILGCVLVGLSHKEINGDGYMDVVSSGRALDKLLDLMPDEFTLTIR